MRLLKLYALFISIILMPVSSQAATITTSKLGWRSGQDVSERFKSLVSSGRFKAGDTLVFSANYQFQGRESISLPPGVTIAGAFFGAGLTVRNTEPETRNGVLRFADNNTLFNFSIEYKETLPTPPVSEGITGNGKSNTRGLLAMADNVTISNSQFRGNVGIHIDVSGENFRISDSHFNGGSNHLRWLSANINHRVDNVLFENALADGIKTVRGPELGTKGAEVSNSVFLNNRRDGIDTTGGFEDSTVTGSYFVNLFKGLDVKNIFDAQTTDLSKGGLNKNITVRDSTFVNVNNGLAAITLDRGNSNGVKWINNANADQFLTQRISVENSSFEGQGRAVLAEDIHSLTLSNAKLYGNVDEIRIKRNSAPSSAVDLNVTTNYNISTSGTQRLSARSAKPDSFYQALAGPDTSLRFGDKNGVVIPPMFLLLDDE